MHPALREVEAKLAGAAHRLHELERCINEGAVTDLLALRTDRDREGRVRVRVEELAEIPEEWHVWIGECVHDMRSALDHLAFQLNVAGYGKDPPPNSGASQFPIYTKRGEFRDMCKVARGRRPDKCKVAFFPRGARTAVERLQPYHHRNDMDTGWLGVLVELSNIDKHRHFPLTPVTPMFLTTPSKVEGHRVTDVWTPYRRLKPNTTIMRLEVPTLPLSVKEPKVNYAYAGGMNFERNSAHTRLPLVMQYEPVDFVLRQTLTFVRERVLPALEPFLE